MDEIGRDTVFVSYSHADRPWLDRLLVLLSPLVRNRRMRVWADPHINVGDEWRRDLTGAIDRAGSAVLLVSADFLASDFIMREELPALVAGGVRLAPVLLRDCLWDHEPLLESVQWAHDPGRDGPIDRGSQSAADRDGRLVRVCRRLIEMVDTDGPRAQAVDTSAPSTAATVVEKLTVSARLGPVDGVPPPPTGYVERGDLDQLRESVLATMSGAVGLTGNAAALGLHGQGGVGKSVLAAAVAQDPRVRAYFPDGVFWVTVGERVDVVAVQVDLLRRLGRPDTRVRSVSDGLRALRESLATRRALLIVDDVWNDADAAAFRAAGPRSRLLYTTRDAQVLKAVRADMHRVDVLNEAAARELLMLITGVEEPPVEMDRVLSATGRVPLALALVGAAVRGGLGWSRVADDLDRGSGTFLDHPYANTFKAMQVATAALSGPLRDAYLSLAVFPPDMAVPVPTLLRYWEHTRGIKPTEAREHLHTLADAELLRVVEEQVTFHDLQHEYLVLQADDLAVLHADLINAYRGLVPGQGREGWWALPRDEPYIWDRLVRHLRMAGNRAELTRTATDPAYLAVQIWRAGTHAAEADVETAQQVAPGEADVVWLRSWLARHAHLFAGLTTLGDIAAALRCWLDLAGARFDTERLHPLLPTVHLVHRWGLASLPATTLRAFRVAAAGSRMVRFSPDGTLLATFSPGDGKVIIWRVDTGTVHAVLDGHSRGVRSLRFSPDGTLIATGDDEKIRLWNAHTGRETKELVSVATGEKSLRFSPDGQLLAVADSRFRSVRRWDVESGRLMSEIGWPDTHANEVQFLPDGRLLAVTVGFSGGPRIWELGTQPRPFTDSGTDPVNSLAFSANGAFLAGTAKSGGGLRLWSAASGRLPVAPVDLRVSFHVVQFGPDGSLLATAGPDGGAMLWDVTEGRLRSEFTEPARIDAARFSPDGKLLAVVGADGTVLVRDVDRFEIVLELPTQGRPITFLRFSPDGHLLATADSGTVRLWSVGRGSAGSAVDSLDDRKPATGLSSNGRRIAAAEGDNGTFRFFNVDDGAPSPHIQPAGSGTYAVAFTPDGRLVASAGADPLGKVSFWRPRSGLLKQELHLNALNVTAMACSPDGLLLAHGGRYGTVELYKLEDGQVLQQLTGHSARVDSLAFAPDGRTLLTGGSDGRARLWDVVSGLLVSDLPGHFGRVASVTFSPDGRLLATADDSGLVRLFETAGNSFHGALAGHAGPTRAVAFSPDGLLLATAGDDGYLRLTDVRRLRQIHSIPVGQPGDLLDWTGAHLAVSSKTVALFQIATR